MKALFSIFFIFLNLICFGQSCEQRLNNLSNAVNNIKTCEQLNYFNNVTFNKSEATKFGNECAMYISENRDEFYAIANKLQTIGKSLNCDGKNSQNESDQSTHITVSQSKFYVKYKDWYIKPAPKCSNEFTHTLCSCDACVCDRCHLNRGKIDCNTFQKRLDAYTNSLQKFNGNELVDENGNLINGSNNQTSYNNSVTPQSNSIINQFKENPIEYSTSITKDGTKLKDEDKKKLLENIESTTNISDFDESKINEILDIKEDNIKVAQEAYHIESRGRSPFFNIVVFSGYKAKFDGILDIDVSIDENGKLTSVSTASKPKDEELNRLVSNYIFEKYSKNREWSPAVGTNGRFISSNLNYKENFHRIIETAKVEQKQKPVDNNKIDNQESENNQSYYQKFIAFKNGLINNTKSSKSEEINSDDKSLEITESMENDAKLGLLQLLSKPKVSMIEVRSYISSNIAKVDIGLRKIWQDAFNEMERMETENK